MKYAVIQLGGKQYSVSEDEVLSVATLEVEEGKEFTAESVLLVVDGDKRDVGTPTVAKAKVVLKVLKHEREPKIRVATFKAKSRERKVYGHKQPITTIRVVSIN